MPRYYFRLTDGKQTLSNHQGVDLAGPAAARENAVAFARELRGGAMSGFTWDGWFVTVVDEHGRQVEEVPIADDLGGR